MLETLPKAPKSLGRTRHVLNSSALAVMGKSNPLGFEPVRSVIVVLVDGLGYRQLEQVAGHAPTVWKNSSPIKSAFPATTSVNIKSFATGLPPAEHGFLGYKLRHKQGVSNLLSDLDKIDINEFDTVKNITQISSQCEYSVVSSAEYENSGFSRVTMTGANYVPAESIDERFERAVAIVKKPRQVVYLYIPELDKTGHKEGWGSKTWLRYLEELDSSVARAARGGANLVLTSDHGMVNTTASEQIHLDNYVAAEDIEAMVGDTRCVYLHTKLGKAHLSNLLQGEQLDVFESQEVESAGWFGGEVREEFRYRLPEIILMARGNSVILHKDFNTERAYKMVGHHGTFADNELEVPLMRIGL